MSSSSAPTRTERRFGPDAKSFGLVLTAVLLVALNLRIPTTALGPLLPQLRADTGRGETFLSLLTTIPLALTLVVAPVAPRLARRLGQDRTVALLLVGIIGGTLVRSVPGTSMLMAGTVLLGCAIAVGTVLAPAVIAAERPARRGVLTGTYTMALSLGPALALGLTVPMMHATSSTWREALTLWAPAGVVALVAWIAYARSSPRRQPPPGGEVGYGHHIRAARPSTVADPRAWVLALYLGITSLTFYTTSAWLPTTFVMDGLAAGVAGGYTSLINIVAVPCALLAPVGMRRGWGPVLAPLAPVLAAAGCGLLIVAGVASALPVALLLGVSQGLCLGVSYAQVVQYARSPEHAASVSALTATAGIALASTGPLAFGFGLEISSSYLVPVSALGVVILLQAVAGLWSGRFSTHPAR